MRILLGLSLAVAVCVPASSTTFADEKDIDIVIPRKDKVIPRKDKTPRRKPKRALGGCHSGVPASLAYYQKCSPFGIRWLVREAVVRRVFGTPSSGGSGSFTYNKFRGRYKITIVVYSYGFGRFSIKGMGFRVTRGIRLGMKLQDVARRIPGTEIFAGKMVKYKSGGKSPIWITFDCYDIWQYQCRRMVLLKIP